MTTKSVKTKKVDWKIESLAGITTFFTMAYILVVNPSILSTQGSGIPFSGALTATVLICFFMTLLMGLYAKLPFAVGPGMGINAFFVYSLILGKQVPWQTALGIVFWAGLIFLLISLTPLRVSLAKAIPQNLRVAAAAGIGLFLAFIGLKNAGLVVADPVTFVHLGDLNKTTVLSLSGLILALVMMTRKNNFAFLASIAFVTFVSWMLGLVEMPKTFFATPDFHSVFFKLDIWGALQWSLLSPIFAMMFTDLFDSISTFIGLSQSAGLLDSKGEPLNLREGLIVDALSTLGAGLVGTSSGTAFAESAAGVEVGGRTGLTAVVTALCFLPCFFLAPLAAVVPAYATAPVLILVGALMFRSVNNLKLAKVEDLVPAFLTIILMPLTFSITQGLLWGFISHVTLYVIIGRGKEIDRLMYPVTAMSLALLILEHCH